MAENNASGIIRISFGDYTAVNGFSFGGFPNGSYKSALGWYNGNTDLTWTTYLAYFNVGTYTAGLEGVRGATHGILDLDLDGVEVGTYDFFGAAATLHVARMTGIAVAAAGIKTVRIRTHGRNGGSGGWTLCLANSLMFWRTA